MLSGEATNTTFSLWFDPIWVRTYDLPHAKHYITDVFQFTLEIMYIWIFILKLEKQTKHHLVSPLIITIFSPISSSYKYNFTNWKLQPLSWYNTNKNKYQHITIEMKMSKWNRYINIIIYTNLLLYQYKCNCFNLSIWRIKLIQKT